MMSGGVSRRSVSVSVSGVIISEVDDGDSLSLSSPLAVVISSMVSSRVSYMVFSMVLYMVCSVVRSRSVSVITIVGLSILHIHSTCSSLSISGPLAMVRYFISSMAMVVMAVVGMLRHNSSVTMIAMV